MLRGVETQMFSFAFSFILRNALLSSSNCFVSMCLVLISPLSGNCGFPFYVLFCFFLSYQHNHQCVPVTRITSRSISSRYSQGAICIKAASRRDRPKFWSLFQLFQQVCIEENGVAWPFFHKSNVLKKEQLLFYKFLNWRMTYHHLLRGTC